MNYSAIITYSFGENVPRAEFEALLIKKGWKNHPDESTYYKAFSSKFDNNRNQEVENIKKYILDWYNSLERYEQQDVYIISLHYASNIKGLDEKIHPFIKRKDIVDNQ